MKGFPERLTTWVCHAPYHRVQSHPCSTDGPHAVVYPSWSEAPLNDLLRVSKAKAQNANPRGNADLEASAPAKYQVSQRHVDIVVDYLRVALRCVIIPHDLHLTNDFDAGSIGRDDHDALLLVRIGIIWITLAEHEVDLRPGVSRAADVPKDGTRQTPLRTDYLCKTKRTIYAH